MQFLPIIKRVAPFFATLVLGMFITSLFVPLRPPQFGFRRGGRDSMRERHREEDRMLRIENDQLREENMRLRNQLNDIQGFERVLQLDVPPPPPPAPMPFGAIPKREQ